MNYRAILHVTGTLLLLTAAAMLLPALCCLFYEGEGDLYPILVSAAVTAGLGAPLHFGIRKEVALYLRDGLFLVVFSWLVIAAVSTLPFLIYGAVPSFTDAFFEMMSGYTTTGATILPDVEALPHGLLFWRSETQLLGGMSFLTLTVFFLPNSMGGVRIFRSESRPGQVIAKDKFTPRNKDAVFYIWGIYLALNLLQTALLCLGGVSLFDALCHAFGTISTGGYATYNASIGHFHSAYVDWVTVVFMFLGGTTFMIFYHALRGEWRIIRINTEFRWYVLLVLFFCGMVVSILWKEGTYGFTDAVRFGTFQVVSILTTTGFTSADYTHWPHAAQMFLYTVCFIGACAGSTTSGIKIVHYVIIWKFMVGAIKKIFFQPLAVVSVRMNERPIDASIINLVVCYFIVNIVLVLSGGCVMVLADDMHFSSGMSAVVATLMNIGPGFGEVGPSGSFAHISDAGKWFLSFNMLVGRLEMFSALVIFSPSFWKR